MMTWVDFTGNPDDVGFLPSFLSENDPRPAKEQLAANYSGGWHPMAGFRPDLAMLKLHYPGDPPLRARAMTMLRDEVIVLFECDFLMIMQPDNSFEVSRVD